MVKIFESMDQEENIASLVSLGLACRWFYQILKALHPTPIRLTYQPATIRHGQCVILTRYVADFLGPQYRQTIFIQINMDCAFQVHFLNQMTFGATNGEAERRFRERVSAYFRMEYWDGGVKFFLLPSPFGKGEDWYNEVEEIMENLDISALPRYAALRWKQTWPNTLAGKYILYNKMMTAWSEWVMMVGL